MKLDQPASQLLVLMAALLIGACAGLLTLTPDQLAQPAPIEEEEAVEPPEAVEPEPIYEEGEVVSPVVTVRVLSHSEWLELHGPASLLAGFPNATSCGDCKAAPPEWWNFTLAG